LTFCGVAAASSADTTILYRFLRRYLLLMGVGAHTQADMKLDWQI